MDDVIHGHIRSELVARRQRLESALASRRGTPGGTGGLRGLLRDVDAALARLSDGTFGLCATCGEAIEAERLMADPLCTFCLDHLSDPQKNALQADIELAARIQAALLPPPDTRAPGWEAAYHYEGAGPTSGDCCDLIPAPDDSLWIVCGDVQGKGLAAALLMSHLHASLRALVSLGLPVAQVLERASRAFCESTLPSHFATMVCVRADRDGVVEVGLAGHPPPLLLRAGGRVESLEAAGLPLGLFCDAEFSARRASLMPGDTLFLYTDGLTESLDQHGRDYGQERLLRVLGEAAGTAPRDLIAAVMKDARAHRAGGRPTDDVTLMAVRRQGDGLSARVGGTRT